VHIGLVSGVEDDRVAWAVEHAVDRHGELDDAEVGSEVAAGARDLIDEKGPDLLGQCREFGLRHGLEVGRLLDALQQAHVRDSSSVRQPTKSRRSPPLGPS
jgi:hypothetical protein